MARVNYVKVFESIASSKSAEKRVVTIANKRFDEAKEEFLEEFDNHPVTKEIETGESSGVLDYGTLRGFIGFPKGSDPIAPVREVLEENVRLAQSKKPVSGKSKVRYTFSVTVPTKALKEASPLPFESGNSWLYGIEDGISGFGNYLYRLLNSPKPSVSGEGIQIKNGTHGDFKPIPYIRALFKNLINKLKK